jgi:L-ascorbate metabolism protein UlaG (beta-lactamase superfamily)
MRLRPGRPDLARHSHRFSVPVAGPDAPLTVTWLGVTTLLIDDGTSAVMTDGFFSRPGLGRVGVGKVSPSTARVDGCLARVGVTRLAAVVPVHTHFDHALDSALVADRTGAQLVGGESAANVGRGHGLAAERLVIVNSGDPIRLGAFDITLVKSRHSPPDRFPGTIDQPVVPPVRAAAYRCGEAWSALIHHRSSGRRLLIQGSAGFVKGSLTGRQAVRRRLLDGDGAGGGRAPRGPGALGRFLPPVVEAVARLALCRRRPGRVGGRPEQAGRAGRCRAGHADGMATRRPVGLS